MGKSFLQEKALMVGNSDGIGLAMTRRLLDYGWNVAGISRSESPIVHKKYHHRVADVSNTTYQEVIEELLSPCVRIVVTCSGEAEGSVLGSLGGGNFIPSL